MAYYVRAINTEFWPDQFEYENITDLSADVLSDLHTEGQDLSFWWAETEEAIDDAVLAYLGSVDRWTSHGVTDGQDFVAINAEFVDAANIEAIQEDNFTEINGYEKKHYNFKNLTVGSLETVVSLVIKAMSDNKEINYDSQQIEKLFRKALAENLISKASIDKTNHGSLLKYIKAIEAD